MPPVPRFRTHGAVRWVVATDTALPQVERAPRVRKPLSALILKWFGIACLMAAATIAGYIGWLLWGTGLTTTAAQHDLRQGFQHVVNTKPITEAPQPGSAGLPLRGSAYGELIIPRIDFDMIVVQGTDEESLKKGPGHYPDTADPWDTKGRVGIAGHRTTYLHPFFDLNQVQPGDTITLQTARGAFTYTVTKNFVLPADTAGVVLDQTKAPTLVLTTCNPRYSASERLIVEADRVSSAA
jgi:sortase A